MTTPATPAAGEPEDADLHDLLEEQPSASSKRNHHLEMTPLNLDHLTKGQLDVTPHHQSSPFPNGNLIKNSCSYLAYAHPRLCSGCAILGILLTLYTLLNLALNPTEIFGVIDTDYSNIQSQFDLQQGRIDHWCLQGDNDSCRCEDPLVPTARGEFQTWTSAHRANKDLVKDTIGSTMDVTFVGESLVEEMDGRWMGRTKGAQLEVLQKLFQNKFTKNKSGVQGLALGIAGDTSPNVLWRLLHGEMPDDYESKIWWVSLGMNDLGRMQCSEEVVVIGILRVVEEILSKKPNAQVVVNSMLPMANLRGGIYPHMRDYQDAFKQYGKKMAPAAASHYARNKATTSTKDDENNNNKKHRLLKRRKKRQESEEDEGDDPANPEPLKQAIKRFKKRDPYNPKLVQHHKIHKYSPLLKQNRLPLWTSITAINVQLKRFCAKHERVTFFDATDIFAERVEANTYVLQSDKISVRGHPTVVGYTKWESAILEKVKKMLKTQEEKTKTSSATPTTKTSGKDENEAMEESSNSESNE